MDGDYADASGIVAAVSGAETNSPTGLENQLLVYSGFNSTLLCLTYSQWKFAGAVFFHVFFGGERVFARQHLDKGVALVLVDDACLNCAITVEYSSKLSLRTSTCKFTIRNGLGTLAINRGRVGSMEYSRYATHEKGSAVDFNIAGW